jgi:hypothetical protein
LGKDDPKMFRDPFEVFLVADVARRDLIKAAVVILDDSGEVTT